MTKKNCMALFILMVIFVFLCLVNTAGTTPLFSMQSAQKCDVCHVIPNPSEPEWQEKNYTLAERKCRLSCGVCHVNPTGGGLRNESGFYFGTKALPKKTQIPPKIESSLKAVRSNNFLDIGGDFRFMSLMEEDRDENPYFFPMQADVYINANVLNHLNLLTQFGAQRGANPNVKEVMAIVGDFPYNLYCKAGKFIPPYGHRLEDHNAFIRNRIAFDHSQPQTYVSGVEIGAEPLLFFSKFSLFNEDLTPGYSKITGEGRRGFSGIAGWRGLWLHLGLSYINIEEFAANTDRNAYGVFGAVRFKNLSYLFELDSREDTFAQYDEDAVISFNELNYLLCRGANIKLRFESLDREGNLPDTEKYILGIDLYPYPFTEVNIQYWCNREEPEKSNDRFLVIGHIWF